MKVEIGDIVRVSKESRSKSAGRFVEVVSIRADIFVDDPNNEVKVRIIPKNGQTETQFAYVRAKFLELPVVEEFKWPLCAGIEFRTADEFEIISDSYKGSVNTMCGYITDQWIEDGKKLYNVVFLGDFRVVEESEITRKVSPTYA